jgi:hypothetical protein
MSEFVSAKQCKISESLRIYTVLLGEGEKVADIRADRVEWDAQLRFYRSNRVIAMFTTCLGFFEQLL